MLVNRMNDNCAETVDNKLVTFVDKLCRPKYAAQIMIVTSFWNVSEPEGKRVFETRLRERFEQWRCVLGQKLWDHP
jgi:polyphosphate kinase 2 (PPK2 family)